MKAKLLIVVGPTSSGKSALAVTLARALDAEIISADSRQVYRGMDIGTGKIPRREMKGVPHHLLDIASAKRTFTAADFMRLATRSVRAITVAGRLPILVGGTGFYIDALVGRATLPNVRPNQALRRKLQRSTPAELFARLKREDPARARTIDPHNARRLVRALEIARELGTVPQMQVRDDAYDAFWIGLSVPREILNTKIRARLLARMRCGMVAEAKRLHAAGISYRRMESFGLEYRALARFLQGKTTRREMLSILEREICRYAKRQLTYWRRNTDIHWYRPSQRATMLKDVCRWLAR